MSNETKDFHFELPIDPKGQMRARSTVAGKFVRVYKDPKQVKAEREIFQHMEPYLPSAPLIGPLSIDIQAFLCVPPSYTKSVTANALLGLLLPTKKPDIDNLAKNILDVMNGRFYLDDKQVVDLNVSKRYGPTGKWVIDLTEYANA